MTSIEHQAVELRRLMRLRQARAFPLSDKGGKEAAVLILLDGQPGAYKMLLCVRSENLRRHPGEVCFPGGMWDKDDRDLIATACREAEEEIGITRDDYIVLGSLPPFLARFGIYIHPCVALLKRPCEFRLNAEEVSRCFWKPVGEFLDAGYHDSYQLDDRYEVHSFYFQEAHCYGVTALMGICVAMGILQRHPEFNLTPQVTKKVMSTITVDQAIDTVFFCANKPFKSKI